MRVNSLIPNVLPQLRRTILAAQIEHGLTPLADDVNVRGPVIVRVDHGAQSIKAKNRGHGKTT